jgi:hypothetical protein
LALPDITTVAAQLDNWVHILKTLQGVCAGQFNATTSSWSLNKIAGSCVCATVGKNIAGFESAVAKALANPKATSLTIGDQETFADLTDDLQAPQPNLDSLISNLLTTVSDPSCLLADGSLDEGQTLDKAFPAGSTGWADLLNCVENANLDRVLGDSTKVRADLATLRTPGSGTNLHDLLACLTTIQA